MMSFRRPLLLSTFAFAILSQSCGSSPPAPPSAYISSTLGASAIGGGGTCNVANPGSPFMTVGTIGAPAGNGSTDVSGDAITVTCTVTSTAANTYAVNALVSLGPNGNDGNLTINGQLSDIPGTQTGFTGSFGKLNEGNYSEKGCTVVLTTQASPPITAGRVWGTMTCPMVVDAEANYTCDATAEFLLENCGE